MKFAKLPDSRFVLRLIKGEEVVASLITFCENQNIKNAVFWGIGSIENVTLAHYRVNTKKFSEKEFLGIFEMVSLIGNVGIWKGKPLVHPHCSISDERMNVYGGHLMSAKVSATVEVVLTKLESALIKKFDEKIGLKLWDLPEDLV